MPIMQSDVDDIITVFRDEWTIFANQINQRNTAAGTRSTGMSPITRAATPSPQAISDHLDDNYEKDAVLTHAHHSAWPVTTRAMKMGSAPLVAVTDLESLVTGRFGNLDARLSLVHTVVWLSVKESGRAMVSNGQQSGSSLRGASNPALREQRTCSTKMTISPARTATSVSGHSGVYVRTLMLRLRGRSII